MRVADLMSLDEWRVHLEAAQGSGMTVADYARQHGLSLSGMYSARYALKRRKAVGAQARARVAHGGFVRVVVPSSRGRLTARLPNGVELALEADDEGTVQAVLSALAMLRCGA
jgi:hypothetical protein